MGGIITFLNNIDDDFVIMAISLCFIIPNMVLPSILAKKYNHKSKNWIYIITVICIYCIISIQLTDWGSRVNQDFLFKYFTILEQMLIPGAGIISVLLMPSMIATYKNFKYKKWITIPTYIVIFGTIMLVFLTDFFLGFFSFSSILPLILLELISIHLLKQKNYLKR